MIDDLLQSNPETRVEAYHEAIDYLKNLEPNEPLHFEESKMAGAPKSKAPSKGAKPFSMGMMKDALMTHAEMTDQIG